MPSALASRLDKLEAEISPPSGVTTVVGYAFSEEEYNALLEKERDNIFAQGEVYFLSWLPPQD